MDKAIFLTINHIAMLRPRLMFGPRFMRFAQFFAAPTCAAGCDADLPAVGFSDCTPEVPFSEIGRVFVAKSSSTPFTDWTEASEWTTRLSQTSVSGNDYIRPLTVIGDKPAATEVTRVISNNRTIVVGKDHVINYTVDDVSDPNYNFMRAIECGGKFRLWWETTGGKMYGGNEGVMVRITGNLIQNRGTEETETIAGVITWRAKQHPDRTDSPIFGSSTETTAPTTYNVTQVFSSVTTDTDNGVTTTVAATNANLKFEFNSIASPTGLPKTMILRIATVQVATVDFPNDYTGTYFRFTSTAGTVYVKQFQDGTVNLA